MTKFIRIMLGKASMHAEECFEGGFIGVDFSLKKDLTAELAEDWREFNRALIPVWLESHPGKSKVAAGLACKMTWTVAKGLSAGDVVISPSGDGRYRFGEVIGDYEYKPGQILFHRRDVRWLETYVSSIDISKPLLNAMRSIGTTSDVTQYGDELKALLKGDRTPKISQEEAMIEEPSVFVLEKYLEEFLVSNWEHTDLGKRYDIFSDEDGTGQQYETDAGRIDILAVSKDGSELLIIELKKGRASDVVAGQIARYMGYVMSELALPNQRVRGLIVAREDDSKLRYSLKAIPNVDFYRYEVSFKLTSI
jgi:restriction system protein